MNFITEKTYSASLGSMRMNTDMFVCDRPDKYRAGRALLDDGARGLPPGLRQ